MLYAICKDNLSCQIKISICLQIVCDVNVLINIPSQIIIVIHVFSHQTNTGGSLTSLDSKQRLTLAWGKCIIDDRECGNTTASGPQKEVRRETVFLRQDVLAFSAQFYINTPIGIVLCAHLWL